MQALPITWLDLAVIVSVLAMTTTVGLYFTRKGSKDMSTFFVSGRSLPWYIAGGSMIATSFAADTPLWVTNLVRQHGVHYIWQFWAPFLGSVMAAVYFGRKWRRMGFTTDIEFLECRYQGNFAKVLRGWSGGFGALVMCPLISGWVIKAMETISREALGLPEEYRFIVTVAVVLLAVMVCAFSGLFGVVYSDFLQLIFATVGTFMLAFLAVQAVGGLDALVLQLGNLPDWPGRELNILPSIGDGAHQMTFWNAIGFFGILWLGLSTSGGHQAQRLLASKDSRHASGAQFTHSIIYFAILAWPWILVALCSLILLPEISGADQASAYPRMLVLLMPDGLRGMLIAALLAAFISTISTLFNWGSSYLMNDVYRRFIQPNASERSYIVIARLLTIFIGIAGAAVSLVAENIQQLLTISYVIGAGTVVTTILRWAWWRLNRFGDFAALLAGWVLSLSILLFRVFDRPMAWLLDLPEGVAFSSDPGLLGARMLTMVIGVTLTAVVVSLLTPPEKAEVLDSFLRRARPFACGWRPIVKRMEAHEPYQEVENLPRTLISWAIGVVTVFSLLFGIGQLLIGIRWLGLLCFIIFAVGLTITLFRLQADYRREIEIYGKLP
jgi:Na+/proline symporter